MKKQVILLALIMFVIVQAGASMQASAQVDGVDAPGGLKVSPLHANYFQQDAHSAFAQAIEAFSFATSLSAPEKIAEPKIIDEPSPDYYDSMVFQSYRDRTWEIYWSSWSSLSSNFKRLTYNNAFDGEPRLNRGCTQIVFTSDRDGANNIYRMDSEGSDVVRLTQNAGNNINPTWSPDSERIAFVSDRDGNQEIYIMNSDGTQPWRLTYSPFPDIRPVYSPDGRQIAWIRVVDREYGVILIADHTGADLRVISSPLRFLGGLVWSPQGDRLAFHFDHDLDGWSSLGIIGVDGADLQVVDFTSFPEQDFLLGSWSSSGKMLYATQIQWVFYRGRYYIQAIHTRRIYASGGGGNTIYHNQPDLYPYVQLADINIPESRLHPLPPYSRIQDFSVRYSVYDPGPAFVRGLYIETRVGKDGEWTLAGTVCCPRSSGKFAYQGVPGQTVYFRSRAQDNAAHWEAWPEGDGDAWTTFYSWGVSGLVTDNRGQPIPRPKIHLDPAPLFPIQPQWSGAYLGLLEFSGPHTITIDHPGYGNLPPIVVNFDEDRFVRSYLPDATNWLGNGDFEAVPDSFAGWRLSNAQPPANSEQSFSGRNSAHLSLNPDCALPCLSDPEFPITGDVSLDASTVAAQSDRFGNLHVVVDRRYLVRHSTGVWSAPIPIAGPPPHFFSSRFRPGLAVDQDGGVHVVIPHGDTAIYAYKPRNGNWTDHRELWIIPGERIFRVNLALNPQGVVAISYTSIDAVETWNRYIFRLSPGVWSEPIATGGWKSNIAPGSDGNFYLAIYLDNKVCVKRISVASQVDQNFEWCSESFENSLDFRLVSEASGALHLAVLEREGTGPYARLFYWRRNAQGSWSSRKFLGSGEIAENFDLDVDADGAVHLIALKDGLIQAQDPLKYFYLGCHECTPIQRDLPAGQHFAAKAVSLDIDAANRLHLVEVRHEYALAYRSASPPSGERTSSLATTLTIPADAHRPTLAMMMNVAGMPGLSALNVSISDGETLSRTLIAAATTNGWEQRWVSLDEWSGKTITVTFTLTGVKNGLFANAWLDAITAGEWRTPVVVDVTPRRVEAGTGGVITMQVENLSSLSGVAWGDLPLVDVHQVDAQTIQARIPASASIDIRPLIVTTVEGQQGVSPISVEVGNHLFLPYIARQ